MVRGQPVPPRVRARARGGGGGAPEFKSRPDRPHPLFDGFIASALAVADGREPTLRAREVAPVAPAPSVTVAIEPHVADPAASGQG